LALAIGEEMNSGKITGISMLIESPPNESKEQFHACVVELLIKIYGRMPEWLEFKIGDCFERRGTFFRRFVCPAGSVSAFMQQHASQSDGIARAIILRGTRFDKPCCSEIRSGIETEFDCEELRQIES
jgi:hypothetical protein